MSEHDQTDAEAAPAVSEDAASDGGDAIDTPIALPEVDPPDRDTELSRQVHALDVILKKTARAAARPLLIEGAIWYVATCVGVVLSALLFALLFPSQANWLAPSMLLLGLGMASAVAGVSGWLFWRGRGDEVVMARELQASEPRLRHDLVAALRFGRALLDGSFDAARSSPELARAHVKRASSRTLGLLEQGHLAHLLPARDLRPATSAMLGCLALLLIPVLSAPSWVADSLTGSLREKLSSPVRDSAAEYPVVGNLNLTMRPPPYANLETVHEAFSTGNVKVLAGTEVVVQGYALLGRASQIDMLVTTRSGEEQVRAMTLSESGRVSTTLPATEAMTYSFQATLDDGTLVKDPVERRIEVVPDAPPTIELLSHKGELRVGTEDRLELEFSASDDFGITQIARLHAFGAGDAPERLDLELGALASAPNEHQGTYSLDLKAMNLQPRDRVTIYLEASDNNTLTGPGTSRTAPLVLIVASPDDKHRQNLEEQRVLVEALLLSLADFLEAPIGRRERAYDDSWRQVVEPSLEEADRVARRDKLKLAHTRHGALLAKMGELAGRLQEDPLMIPRDLNMFVSLHKQLEALHQKGEGLLDKTEQRASQGDLTLGQAQRLATWAMESEVAIEKGILRLEDLLMAQHMASAQATSEEIDALKERLRELLLEYKETGDPATKEAIKREIKRLRQRMSELIEQMNSQVRELPQEHINREAIEQARLESDTKKLASDFDSIEDLLDKGDIDGALQALDKMGENLDNFTEDLDKQFEQAAPEALDAFDEKVSELMDDVNDLSMRQQSLEQQTRQFQRERQEEQEREAKEMLDGFTEEMLEKVKNQQRELESLRRGSGFPPSLARDAAAVKEELIQLESALEQHDIESSLKHASEVLQRMEKIRFSMEHLKRFIPSNSPRSKRVQEAIDKSRPMVDTAQDIVDDLDDMMDRAEESSERTDPRAEELAEEQRSIQEQAGKLKQKIEGASKDFPQLEQQLEPGMERAQKSMKDARESLEKQRTQRALDSERRALEELRDMNAQMREALQKQRSNDREGSGDEANKEKVVIPETDRSRGESRYRDEIKDTMKEERLDDYSSEIERYYESLIE